MHTWYKIGGFSILILALISWITYRYDPGSIIKGWQTINVWRAELTKKSMNLGTYQIHYYEGGIKNNPTLILLHGLGDDKNAFVRSIMYFTDHYRVILPDLPGHGDNIAGAKQDYSIAGQTIVLSQFIETLDIPFFYLAGNSLGGHLALSLACQNKQKVKGLILINSTGISTGTNYVYQKFPDHLDQSMFQELIAQVFASPPNAPLHFYEYARKEMNQRIPFLNQVIEQIIEGEDYLLDQKISEINTPSLILWGKQDQIVPLSISEKFKTTLPNTTIQYIQDAGHTPQFEVPSKVGLALQNFIDGVEHNQ